MKFSTSNLLNKLSCCLPVLILTTAYPASTIAEDQPWLAVPAVKEVIELRNKDIVALLEGKASNPDAYTSTFVAHTPDRGIVLKDEMMEFLASGTVSYDDVEMDIEYAGAHGNDMVVIMGVEIVVPTKNMRDAGKRVHRRFTDIFRRENGLWRHDLRHASVIKVE